jgi:hypothetical protein
MTSAEHKKFQSFDSKTTLAHATIRIIVPLGMLAARRCGMPEEATSLHANTLHRMKYRVKTAYGISDHHYAGTPAEPLFGTGQGSGASPAIWLTLVVILMPTLDRIIPDRIHFRSPDDNYQHSRLIDAFVDNTSLAFTASSAMSHSDMITRMETAAQTWQHLLSHSGGTLNFQKCSWSLLFWIWINGRPQLQPRQALNNTIELRSAQTSPDSAGTPIKYTNPYTATKMLGVHLSPAGDFTIHLQHLRSKADSYAQCLRTSNITGSELHTFIRSVYSPSMLYSLPTLAVNEDKMQPVQTKLLATVLNKLGASSTTPTPIRHGPHELGGLNLPDLRTEVGIANIRFLRNAIYTDTEAGKLLLLSLKYTQLEAGIPEDLLSHPTVSIPYITDTWITSVRRFAGTHSIKIHITNTLRIRFNGPYDSCIMVPPFLQRYTVQQQVDINLVRLHLQVLTLADMSDPTSTDIAPWALDGITPPHFSPQESWPRQPTPTISQRRLWKRYISSNFLRYGSKWRVPLGPIILLKHRLVRKSDGSLDSSTPVQSSFPPPHHNCTSLHQYLQKLPRWHRRMLTTITQVSPDLAIWRAFRSRRRITIASDGGLRKGIGTFGWKIVSIEKTGTTTTLFEGSGPVDGPFDIATSTRCELGGLVAPLLLCTSLAAYWGLRHKCRYRWLTDSKAAISKVDFITRQSHRVTRAPKDVDYLTAIRELQKSLGKSLKPQWVKGHQDDQHDYDSLSTEAKLNIDVDTLATNHLLSTAIKPTQTTPHTPWLRISVEVNGRRYPSQIDAQIRFHIKGSYLKDHLQARMGWTEATWAQIDLHSFGRHFRNLSSPQKVQHMKFVYDLHSTGDRKQKTSRTTPGSAVSTCPCCSIALETTHHLLHCQCNSARAQSIKTFGISMRKLRDNPYGRILAELVSQWMRAPNSPPSLSSSRDMRVLPSCFHPDYLTLVQTAISDQTTIGWHNLIKGFFAKSWHVLASSYPPNKRLPPLIQDDGHHRIQQSLKALCQMVLDIWEARNHTLHKIQENTAILIRTAIDAEIAKAHAQRSDLLIADQHYCNVSLNKLLRSRPSYKRRWLHRIKKAQQQSRLAGCLQPKITAFFHRNKPCAPTEQNTLTHATNPVTASITKFPKTHRRLHNLSTQQLLTNFLQERASNQHNSPSLPMVSPPPVP